MDFPVNCARYSLLCNRVLAQTKSKYKRLGRNASFQRTWAWRVNFVRRTIPERLGCVHSRGDHGHAVRSGSVRVTQRLVGITRQCVLSDVLLYDTLGTKCGRATIL